MRRLNRTGRGTLLLIVLLSLGVGGLVAALAAPDDAAPPSLTVPAGRAGDTLAYARFHHSDFHTDDGDPDGGDWRLMYVDSLRVAGVEEAHDASGDVGRFLVVERNVTAAGHDPRTTTLPKGPTGALGVPDQGSSYLGSDSHTEVEFIDLATRHVVRTDQQTTGDMAGREARFQERNASLPALAMQGKTLTAGAPVDDALVQWKEFCHRDVRGPFGSAAASRYYDDLDTSPEAVKTTAVTGWGSVDGVPALAVKKTITYSGPPPFGGATAIWSDIELQVRVWLHEGDAYPVLVQCDAKAVHTTNAQPDSLRFASQEDEHIQLVRVAHERGTGDQIAWDSSRPGTTDPVRPEEPSDHRDGATSPLAYPLAQAVRDVEAVAPQPWTDWHDAHPEAELLGGDYAAGNGTDDNREWRLLYATRSGEGLTVHVARPTDRNATVAVLGPVDVSASARERPHDPNASFVHGGELWYAVFETRAPAPTRASWGPAAWIGFDYVEPESCRPAIWYFGIENVAAKPRPTRLSQMSADRCDGENTVERERWIEVDPETGLLTGFASSRTAFDVKGRDFTDLHVLTAEQALPQGFQQPDVRTPALVSASLIAIGVGAYFAPTLKFLATRGLMFLPGFSRVKRDNVLDQARREQLMHAVSADPGLSATDLKRRLDVGWGTVVYHLGVLERNGLVSSLADGRHRRFFPVGAIDWSKRGQVALLRNDRARELYELVAAWPGAHQGHLVSRTEVSRATLIWHLGRLEEAGLVARVRDGRKVRYFANAMDPLPEAPEPGARIEVA